MKIMICYFKPLRLGWFIYLAVDNWNCEMPLGVFIQWGPTENFPLDFKYVTSIVVLQFLEGEGRTQQCPDQEAPKGRQDRAQQSGLPLGAHSVKGRTWNWLHRAVVKTSRNHAGKALNTAWHMVGTPKMLTVTHFPCGSLLMMCLAADKKTQIKRAWPRRRCIISQKKKIQR